MSVSSAIPCTSAWAARAAARAPLCEGRGDLVAAAREIGDRIVECRVERAAGPTWLEPAGYATQRDPLRIAPVDSLFYNGRFGIVCFLAALARVAGGAAYRDVALRAIAGARRKLAAMADDPRALGHLPVGALVGTSSLVYGLLRIGELLEEPELVGEAHRLTALLTPEKIARDERVWIQAGSAGALLVMLALDRVAPEPNGCGWSPLDIARRCGEQILARQVAFDGRPAAWLLSPGKPPLVGFSYGAAGICYALARLHARTGDERLLAAAREGLRFLRGFYRPDLGAWSDMRALFEQSFSGPRQGEWMDWWKSGGELLPRRPGDERPAPRPPSVGFNGMWCHGAAGIVLGRLGALDVLDDGEGEARAEIAAALGALRVAASEPHFSRDRRDDLCCGNAGRIMVLQYAAERLGDASLDVDAAALAARVVQRFRSGGGLRFSSGRGTDAFSPTLFQGAAGVGYALLRLAAPRELPCLLLID